jgi:hypothetical protein
MFRRNFLVNSVGDSRLAPVDGWKLENLLNFNTRYILKVIPVDGWKLENLLNRCDLSAKARLPLG